MYMYLHDFKNRLQEHALVLKLLQLSFARLPNSHLTRHSRLLSKLVLEDNPDHIDLDMHQNKRRHEAAACI